jgi:hypothetical protein
MVGPATDLAMPKLVMTKLYDSHAESQEGGDDSAGKKSSRQGRQESKGRKEESLFFFAPFASLA